MPTFIVSNQDQTPSWQREIITTDHFGTNLLLTNVPSGSTSFTSSYLPSAIASIGATSLRYPGGAVTEIFFSMSNPNNTTWTGSSLPNVSPPTNLIGQGEFLKHCAKTGASAIMVIPTQVGFTQTAAQALMSGTYGSRAVDPNYLSQVTAYVKSTMLAAYEQDKPVHIDAFEIGNEFWGSGQMTASEYGRLAAGVLQAAEAGINQALAQQPRLSDLERPDLIVQSVHAAGKFSPSLSRTVFVSGGFVYNSTDDIPAGANYSTFTIAAQGNAANQLEQLTAGLKSVIGLIDGAVDHYYTDSGFSGVDSQDFTFTQMGRFEYLLKIPAGTLDRYVTEWNAEARSENCQGLQGAAMLVETFYELVTHHISKANVWPLVNYSDLTNLVNGADGTTTVTGAMFKLMRESLIGSAPVLDSNLTVGGVTLDTHGFTSERGAVLFLSNRGDEVVSDVSLDMVNTTYTFDPKLSSSKYFIVTTKLSAVDSAGLVATGNSGGKVSPVLVYSDGRVTTGDLLGIGNMAGWGNARVEITYVTEGADAIHGRGGNDSIDGSGGADSLWGDAGNDTLSGGTGNDSLMGNSGNDIIYAGTGTDTMIGGDGNDVYFTDGGDIIIEAVNYGTDQVNSSTSYTLSSNVERLALTGSAIINGTGNNLANAIFGNLVANSLAGIDGNDSLYGYAGNDTLDGGAGIDRLEGGDGNDRLVGGDGADAAIFTGTTAISVNLVAGTATGQGTDTLVGVEQITTSSGNDTVLGDAQNNLFSGQAGNDLLKGEGGADRLIGGAGADVLYGGVDTVADQFAYYAASESPVGTARDKVYQFVSGVDDFDLRAMDANASLAGDQAFLFSGTTAKANAVWYADIGTDIVLRGDTTGDGVADFEVQVIGINSVAAGDFLL